MIRLEESQKLINDLLILKNNFNISKSKEDEKKLSQQKKLCLEKFGYIISTRVSRYKYYDNYEDLYQEAVEAFFKAIDSYNPQKGNFFWWCHKHINTKVGRAANAFSSFRVPISKSKDNPPRKEKQLPTMLDEIHVPEIQLEKCQIDRAIQNSLSHLPTINRNIIILLFGLNGDKPNSITKIGKILEMERHKVTKIVSMSMDIIRENIKL